MSIPGAAVVQQFLAGFAPPASGPLAVLEAFTLWRWHPEDSKYLIIVRRATTPMKDDARGS